MIKRNKDNEKIAHTFELIPIIAAVVDMIK